MIVPFQMQFRQLFENHKKRLKRNGSRFRGQPIAHQNPVCTDLSCQKTSDEFPMPWCRETDRIKEDVTNRMAILWRKEHGCDRCQWT